MPDLTVYGGQDTFEVQGSIAEGTLVFFVDRSGYANVPASTWKALLKELNGQTVTLAALCEAVTRTAGFKRDLAAPLAAILVAEGLATPAGPESIRIKST